MSTPSLTPAYILAVITTVVGLFVTQGLISNGTEKLVTGLAAAFVPLGIALAHSLFHAHVQAAKINARSHVVPAPAPAPAPKRAGK